MQQAALSERTRAARVTPNSGKNTWTIQTSASDEATLERKRVLVGLISATKLLLGHKALPTEDMVAYIRTFEAICGAIPTTQLVEAFEISWRMKDENGKPIYWDARCVAAAWGQMQERDPLDQKPERAKCRTCKGSGHFLVYVPLTGESKWRDCIMCKRPGTALTTVSK